MELNNSVSTTPDNYIVLRNQIPIFTNHTPLPPPSGPDFIPLGDDDEDCITHPAPPHYSGEPLPYLIMRDRTPSLGFQSPMLKLHIEILDFCYLHSPSGEEQVSRNAAVERVSHVIKYIWPHSNVQVFGSYKTGLFKPACDVDMVILGSHIKDPLQGLRALRQALSVRGVANVNKIQVSSKTRVPMAKFVELKSGLSFDISFDMENGPKAVEYIQDAISKCPALRPMCLILKFFLQQHRLNEFKFIGGIGSYALLAMLIAMLQDSLENHYYPQYHLGDLLVTFFDMYGCKLNTFNVGISCNEGSAIFSKKCNGVVHQTDNLLTSTQDRQIKSKFRLAHATLTDTNLISSLGPDRSILSTIVGSDNVLERKPGLNGDVTLTNLLPKAGEVLQNDVHEHKPPLKRCRMDSSLFIKEPERSLEASLFKSPMLQLHKEIMDFCDLFCPTAEEQVSRNTAVERVSDVIKGIWPNCKVQVFGSYKTGLFLPTCEVDMVILGSHIGTPKKGLRALRDALSQRGVANKIQVNSKARVPIIKFVDVKSGFSFDISFDMENGPKAVEYIQDALSKCQPLRPLCLILKLILQQRKLNEVHHGGIGSYALLTMLISMLQNSLDNHSFPQYNLGVLLVTFFDMYGCKLNTFNVGIPCNEGNTFVSKRCEESVDPKKLLFDEQIKSSFKLAHAILTDTNIITSLGTIIEPDKVLLKRKGGLTRIVTSPNLLPKAGSQNDVREHEGLSGKQHINDEEPPPLPHEKDIVVGTIIKPDQVLLKHKGGLTRIVTSTNLLPKAGEVSQNAVREHEGLSGKQHIDNEEPPPLPHGKDIVVSNDGVAETSERNSKKVIKARRLVRVKKIRKVIVIKS